MIFLDTLAFLNSHSKGFATRLREQTCSSHLLRIHHQFHVNPPLTYLSSALGVVNAFVRKGVAATAVLYEQQAAMRYFHFHPTHYQSRLLSIDLRSDLRNEGTGRL